MCVWSFVGIPQRRRLLESVLVRWCVEHNTRYRQGLNEVLAPFVALVCPFDKDTEHTGTPGDADATVTTQEFETTYALFSAFTQSYLSRFYIPRSDTATPEPSADIDASMTPLLAVFKLLLKFHDPLLHASLEKEGIGPELYATQWIITALSRGTDLEPSFWIWDAIICLNDASFILVLTLELLRTKRVGLMHAQSNAILEAISTVRGPRARGTFTIRTLRCRK